MLPDIILFQSWLRRKAPHASTPVHYGSDLSIFFNWLGKTSSDVLPTDIDAFITQSQAQGFALTTINRRLAAIRSFFHYLAIFSENAPNNPVIPKRHFIRLGQHLPRDVEDTIIEKLFAAICGPRDRAMFLLMLRCGLRVGEVRNLSLNDLYLQPTQGNLPRLWLNGKGSKQRVAYLSDQPLAALHVWLAIRPNTNDQAVFLNRFGTRLTVTGIQSRLAVYCRETGVWVTCHQLRHTFGRHLIEANVPVTTIQQLMGHARLRTTEVYLHISDQQVQNDYQAAMRTINDLLPLEGEKS